MTGQTTKPHGILREVKDAIRKPRVWPGGYDKRIILDDGEMLCHDCARKQFKNMVWSALYKVNDGFRPIAVDAYWEGPDQLCASCNAPIPSEYGDPNPAEQEQT